MASVSLTRVIEKMKLENLTPETDVKHVKITQPDICLLYTSDAADDPEIV